MTNHAGSKFSGALVLLLALAAPLWAEESRLDVQQSLADAVRAFHTGLLAPEAERHVAALEAMLPLRDDIDAILGDLGAAAWDRIEGWRNRVIEAAELVSAEISASGAPKEIEVIDLRAQPDSHLRAALAVVPPEIPACSVKTTYEKSVGGTSAYFYVGERWVWIRGFGSLVPKLIDRRAAATARVGALLARIEKEWASVVEEVECDIDPASPVDADRTRQDETVHHLRVLCEAGEFGEIFDEFIHPHIKLQIVASIVTEDDLAASVPEDSTELLAGVREVLVGRRKRGAKQTDALEALLERLLLTDAAGLAVRARRSFVNHLAGAEANRLTDLLSRVETAIPLVSSDSEKLRCLQRVVLSPAGHSTEYVMTRDLEDQLWHLELGYRDGRWMLFDYD